MMSSIKQIKSFSAKNLISENTHYLLLEGDLNENLYDEVSSIEFKVSKQWVYEDTEFNDEKEHGPLLVELDAEHKLLNHFISHWSQQHMGVIISTQESIEILIQHLLDLRYVTIPNGDPLQKVLFRWYEPRQFVGLLKGFDDRDISYFMSPITSISWCEWAYDQGLWYQVIKPEIENVPDFSPKFEITQVMIESMDKQDEKYFVREVTRELIDEHPDLLKKGSEKALDASILKQTRLAISKGIDRRNNIKEFIYKKLNA